MLGFYLVMLRKGGKQMSGRKYWWVSKTLMIAKKITLFCESYKWKKTAANVRAGIKHSTWSFENQLVWEEWIDDKGIVFKRNNDPWLKALSSCWMLVCSAARMNEEETERAFARPFILPGKVIRVVWFKSSSLDENIKSKLQRLK